ncbi:MAG: hypothetical protein ACAI38_18180 [Myxococcota bacterium]|nr:hypothetical protein [Myxococcota bacterium]
MALAKLREASVRLRGVDLADYNRDWARQMVESGTASNPAFYQLLEKAAATIKEAYRKHLGREPTKDEMGVWLPFAASMDANERQWATNVQRLQDRANLEQAAAMIAARNTSSTAPLTDAQIADYIRANLKNPNAITAAMLQYGVSFARVQAALGATSAEIAAYVANSNNDTLKRLYAEQTGTPSAPTDAQIADFIRANIQNPNAIASAMVQYGVSFARVQAATGSSAADIATYVASSNSDSLKRLYAQQTSAPATTTPTTPTTTPDPTPTPTPTTSAAVSDAQIADFIRANLQNPDAIAGAMLQYGVSMSRLQAAIGASWDEIKAYVGSSNNDTLKRLLAEATGA